jgi:hypothetical protein
MCSRPALRGNNDGFFIKKEAEPITGAASRPFRRVIDLAQVGEDDLRGILSESLQA